MCMCMYARRPQDARDNCVRTPRDRHTYTYMAALSPAAFHRGCRWLLCLYLAVAGRVKVNSPRASAASMAAMARSRRPSRELKTSTSRCSAVAGRSRLLLGGLALLALGGASLAALDAGPHWPKPMLRWRLFGGAEPCGVPRLPAASIVPRGETSPTRATLGRRGPPLRREPEDA